MLRALRFVSISVLPAAGAACRRARHPAPAEAAWLRIHSLAHRSAGHPQGQSPGHRYIGAAAAVTASRGRPRKYTAVCPGSAGAGGPSLRSGSPPAPAGGHGLRTQKFTRSISTKINNNALISLFNAYLLVFSLLYGLICYITPLFLAMLLLSLLFVFLDGFFSPFCCQTIWNFKKKQQPVDLLLRAFFLFFFKAPKSIVRHPLAMVLHRLRFSKPSGASPPSKA